MVKQMAGKQMVGKQMVGKGELETWRSGSLEMLWAHPLNNPLLLQMTKDGVAEIQDSRWIDARGIWQLKDEKVSLNLLQNHPTLNNTANNQLNTDTQDIQFNT